MSWGVARVIVGWWSGCVVLCGVREFGLEQTLREENTGFFLPRRGRWWVAAAVAANAIADARTVDARGLCSPFARPTGPNRVDLFGRRWAPLRAKSHVPAIYFSFGSVLVG